MPFKDHLQKRTGIAVGDSTVATRPAVSRRSCNTSFPIVLARVYHMLSPLPPKLKRKRAVSNLRSCIAQHYAQARRISEPAAVSHARGPSPSQVLTTSATIGRRGPFPTGLPDPLRCQPPFPAQKPQKSRSQKRRGAVFTREEKTLLEKALPAVTEEADDRRGRRASATSIYELEAPIQVSLSSGPVYELEAATSRDSLGEISLSNGSVYELEAATSRDNSSEVSLPSVVVSDYEPILSTNQELREENRHMSAFLQEIVTKDIIINEKLERVKSECKATTAALHLLWELVKKDFDGSENVATSAQIVQFLSTRELLDRPRQLNKDRNA